MLLLLLPHLLLKRVGGMVVVRVGKRVGSKVLVWLVRIQLIRSHKRVGMMVVVEPPPPSLVLTVI